jgi:hypothetical protein
MKMKNKKEKLKRKCLKKKLKIYILLTHKDCGLFHDKPILLTGRTTQGKQNRNRLDYSQNLVMSVGTAQRQDELTAGCQLQSNSDSDSDNDIPIVRSYRPVGHDPKLF